MDAQSPLTGEQVGGPVGSISSEQIIKDWISTFSIDISNELHGVQQILRYKCPDSGLYFFKPDMACGSNNLYKQLGRFPWYYAPNKWEYFQSLKLIPSKARLIEVGCGSGDFLSLVEESDRLALGVDINEEAVAAAKERGLNALCIHLSEISKTCKGCFDVLCAFQVLEHLISPLDFLRCALSLVNDRGLLFFATPNSESFLRYQYTLLDMPPHHMSQWNIQAYRYLEHILPVKLEAFFYEPLSEEHLPHYSRSTANHLCKKFGANLKTLVTAFEAGFATVLKAGLSKYVKGQGILVVLRKTGK